MDGKQDGDCDTSPKRHEERDRNERDPASEDRVDLRKCVLGCGGHTLADRHRDQVQTHKICDAIRAHTWNVGMKMRALLHNSSKALTDMAVIDTAETPGYLTAE